MLTGLNHADEEPVKHSRMLGDRFIESLAALDASSNIAYDMAEIALALRIALLVKSGQSLHERNTGLDHGGELAGEQHHISLLNRPYTFFCLTGVGLPLQ